jgi:glycosyltransferase involved in cell wall biosynthesis
MSGSTLALVIPAFNPAAGLPDLARSMVEADPSLFVAVVVVDDGSRPECAGIFQAVQRGPRAVVVHRETNGGKGAALKLGFAHVLRGWPDLAGVVTADADGQHAPSDVARVARALAATPDRLVLGVRAFVGRVPLRSRVGNVVTRALFRLATGTAIGDTQTGLRGWPRAHMERALDLPGNGFEFELEALFDALDGPITQLAIETIYSKANESSHFRPLQDSLRIYRVLARHAVRRKTPSK